MRCFILDNHRPVHLANVHSRYNVVVLDNETVDVDCIPSDGSDLSNESSEDSADDDDSNDEDEDENEDHVDDDVSGYNPHHHHHHLRDYYVF